MTTKVPNRVRPFVFPFYPLLIGLFPVLYLWSANRAQIPAYVLIPSLVATVIGLLVLFLVTLAIFRDLHRAALFTAVLGFIVLAYGHFSNLVTSWVGGFEQTILLIVTALLILVIFLLIITRRIGSPNLTKTLNLVAAAIVLFQLVPAAPYYLQIAQLNQVASANNQAGRAVSAADETVKRDVYFILIDNYGRQDDLLNRFDFDNSELVTALKARGFVFPDCAQGNYFWTAPAISSILNMDYLDKLGIEQTAYIKRGKYDHMAPLLQNSKVLHKFSQYGYHTVTFRGFMGLIDIKNSDTYINYENEKDYSQRLETRNFESLYLQTTIFSAINDQYQVYPELVEKYGPPALKEYASEQEEAGELDPKFKQVYDQNLYAYNALERVPREIQSPKFVYAHIYSAHWPFMLKPDGSMRLPFTQKMTKEGYVDAVKYTNSRILDSIDSILKNSKVEPIIILQGDHSNGWVGKVEWSGEDRVKILSAYYLPDGGEKELYDTISPVNNFRLIFKQYFGEDIELLPDVNYILDPETKKQAVAPSTCISENLP